MLEKRTKQCIRKVLESQLVTLYRQEQILKRELVDGQLVQRSTREKAFLTCSTNERNMTRTTRSRQPRFHSVFQSGYCAVCHIPYIHVEDHLQSKRHLKLAGEDGSFISIKGFDTFLELDGDNSLEVNAKSCESSDHRRTRMPRTRTSSLMYDKIKDTPLSPVGNESGHHLRSRKNVNYMTPPLDDDSLTEKPEVVKEYRELRSSTRLVTKLTDTIVESDVWSSGRPKRSCNRQRISADERLVVDNQSYYKVEVLPTKLRSGVAPFQSITKRPETPVDKEDDDKSFLVKFRKLRSSELTRLNNEAENFLFPKKDESSDEENDEDNKRIDSSSMSDGDELRNIKIEDDESMHSTSSESKQKKRRRTHAEAFIMDNQKYYKFETPGSRLRYHGSYLSPVPIRSKNNGDCLVKNEYDSTNSKVFKVDVANYNFSFETIPRHEVWYETFQRRDMGREKYMCSNEENYWGSLVLPYQIGRVPPLDPRECLLQYNRIKKCLMDAPSASTSVTCSSPDPNSSSCSTENLLNQDEDSKASSTEVSYASILEDEKSFIYSKQKDFKASLALPGSLNVKNPRKSPRQHASTLAILSSLIQQRKRKSKPGDTNFLNTLPTIYEEPKRSKSSNPKKPKVDYVAIMKNVEEDFARMCNEDFEETQFERDDKIDFKGRVEIEEILGLAGCDQEVCQANKKLANGKPGRKPGKRKKNRTGWPLNRTKRVRKIKEEDDSTVDSISVIADSDICEETSDLAKSASENNNQNDQSSVNIGGNCDSRNADRVEKTDKIIKVVNSDKLDTDIQYQPYVRVQKLERTNSGRVEKRSTSPKRTNRGQRRMPASPKSPRMLRRPRGRWYRER